MVFQGDANHKTSLCIWFDEQNSSILMIWAYKNKTDMNI